MLCLCGGLSHLTCFRCTKQTSTSKIQDNHQALPFPIENLRQIQAVKKWKKRKGIFNFHINQAQLQDTVRSPTTLLFWVISPIHLHHKVKIHVEAKLEPVGFIFYPVYFTNLPPVHSKWKDISNTKTVYHISNATSIPEDEEHRYKYIISIQHFQPTAH